MKTHEIKTYQDQLLSKKNYLHQRDRRQRVRDKDWKERERGVCPRGTKNCLWIEKRQMCSIGK